MAPSTEVLSKKKGPPKKKATKAYRKTIHFNVGGTKYEVSKSLIETYPDTMLATMISDRWQHHDNDNDDDTNDGTTTDNIGWQHHDNDNDDDTNDGTTTDKVLFIDRNGHRFQYVLDYMRDQHVHSTMGVTGASIRKELEYFGFVNVPPDVIDVSNCNLDAAKQVFMANRKSEVIVKDCKTGIEDLMNSSESEIIANYVYQEYMKKGSLRLDLTQSSNRIAYGAMRRLLNREINNQTDRNMISIDFPRDNWRSTINIALTEYGLVMNSVKGARLLMDRHPHNHIFTFQCSESSSSSSSSEPIIEIQALR